MENNLPDIITRLRRERKLTQKQAAAELGVSQSLLSHYERGIRSCGVDFLCRVADYYGVTVDYLLGRTESGGPEVTMSVHNAGTQEKEIFLVLNSLKIKTPTEKDIADSLSMIFDIVKKTGCETLEAETAQFFSIVIYKIFRILSENGGGHAESLFSLPELLARGGSSAVLMLLESRITAHVQGKHIDGTDGVMSPELIRVDESRLMENYPEVMGSLLRVLNSVEGCIPERK